MWFIDSLVPRLSPLQREPGNEASLLIVHVVSEPDPRKIQTGGYGKSAGVEVYTAPGMQAHFRLAFD